MSKSILTPKISLAMITLLLSLALPGISSADQVEDISEIEQLVQQVDKTAAIDKPSATQHQVVTAEKAATEKPATEMTEQNRLDAEKADQNSNAINKNDSEKMASDKVAQKSEPVNNASASTQKTADAPSPSLWQSFLALVGLHDNRPVIPPLEVKNSPLYLGQDYIIGPGDVLGISVWRDDSLTRSVVVLPDGKIQFPLIGEIVAGGNSVAQLKQVIVEKLSAYVVDTDISVEVKQSNSLFIYISGRVNSPGRQMLVANTTVLQALAMAGGLNPFAEKDDIKIFRQDSDRTLVYTFRYSQVVAGNHLDDNLLLKRGDVIVVP